MPLRSTCSPTWSLSRVSPAFGWRRRSSDGGPIVRPAVARRRCVRIHPDRGLVPPPQQDHVASIGPLSQSAGHVDDSGRRPRRRTGLWLSDRPTAAPPPARSPSSRNPSRHRLAAPPDQRQKQGGISGRSEDRLVDGALRRCSWSAFDRARGWTSRLRYLPTVRYQQVHPPSTQSVWQLTMPASGLAKNATAAATSSLSANL